MNKKMRKFKVIPGGSPRRRKWPRRFFALGIIVLSIFLLWHSLGYITLLAAKVTVARHSEVKSGTTIQCVVARNEHLLLSPAEGEYTAIVQNGSRVKVGQVYARVDGTGISNELKAPAAGLIRHGGDGFDGAFPTGSKLNQSLLDSAVGALARQPEVTAAAKVGLDQLTAVIVDNNVSFQLLAGLDFHPPEGRQTLTIQDELRETSFVATPLDIMEYGGKYWVLWRVPALPDSLGLQRVLTAKLITGSQQLVVIPAGALHVREGVEGVFIVYRNKPVFNPVEVVFVDGPEAGVLGLADGQRILSLPRWASFAKRWWQK